MIDKKVVEWFGPLQPSPGTLAAFHGFIIEVKQMTYYPRHTAFIVWIIAFLGNRQFVIIMVLAVFWLWCCSAVEIIRHLLVDMHHFPTTAEPRPWHLRWTWLTSLGVLILKTTMVQEENGSKTLRSNGWTISRAGISQMSTFLPFFSPIA